MNTECQAAKGRTQFMTEMKETAQIESRLIGCDRFIRGNDDALANGLTISNHKIKSGGSNEYHRNQRCASEYRV